MTASYYPPNVPSSIREAYPVPAAHVAVPSLASPMLDLLPLPALLADASGAVLDASTTARELLACADGLAIEPPRLVASRPAATQMLRGAVRGAALSQADSECPATHVIALARPSGRRPLRVTIRRIVESVGETAAVCLLLIDHAAEPMTCPVALEALYDLTPAEARLTALLAEGHTLGAAAAVLAVSRNTAATHLKRVFAKTGAARQAELVARVLGSSAMLPGLRPQHGCISVCPLFAGSGAERRRRRCAE